MKKLKKNLLLIAAYFVILLSIPLVPHHNGSFENTTPTEISHESQDNDGDEWGEEV